VSDFSIPDMDGLDFCHQLRSQLEGQLIPFIFLSSQGDLKDYFVNNIEQITKPFDLEELLVKVEALLERSDSVDGKIGQQTPIKREKTQIINQLTPAEKKVFWQVIQGLTNREIGKHLFISHRTVQTHLSNILAKLGLENRRQLVKFAYEQGYGEVKHHE
jgi:DNA-binding NarL/FixJ family response regulator